MALAGSLVAGPWSLRSLASCVLLAATLVTAQFNTGVDPNPGESNGVNSQYQSLNVTHAPFTQPWRESEQRQAINYTGFLFDFNTEKPAHRTPKGNIKANHVNTNPFISTLPDPSNAQTLITLGPCTSNTPHTHPRGSEIAYLIKGEIVFGMVEEDSGKNRLILRNMKAGQTIHIPQGLVHFSHNSNCQEEAQFLSNFGNPDPGTQTIWESLFSIPAYILHATSGLPEREIKRLQAMPQVETPGTGGEACLARCNLQFNSSNSFHRLTPNVQQS